MEEQSYLATSVSKSSTGELLGTHGWYAAGGALVGDDLKKQSYLGVERGESLDEAAAAPTAEFGCDGWTRVERSEFLDEAAAARSSLIGGRCRRSAMVACASLIGGRCRRSGISFL